MGTFDHLFAQTAIITHKGGSLTGWNDRPTTSIKTHACRFTRKAKMLEIAGAQVQSTGRVDLPDTAAVYVGDTLTVTGETGEFRVILIEETRNFAGEVEMYRAYVQVV